MIEILRRISAYTILYDLKMNFTFFEKEIFSYFKSDTRMIHGMQLFVEHNIRTIDPANIDGVNKCIAERL